MKPGERGSQAGAALVGFAIGLALYATAGEMKPSPAEPPPQEEPADAQPKRVHGYSNCASMIGCYVPSRLETRLWDLEKLEMAKRGEPLVEPTSSCVGFCFNAVIESVDEENWRIANVGRGEEMGKRTRAVVERTRVLSSSRDPAAEGKPVRFACFDRIDGESELRFESCSQMAVLE